MSTSFWRSDQAWSYVVAPTNASDQDGASIVKLTTRAMLLVLIYWLVARWIFTVGLLDESSYTRSVIAWGFIEGLVRVKAIVPLAAIVLLSLFRPMWIRWEDLEHGGWIRRFVFLPTVVLAWSYSTYDFNAFFGQPHFADRLLIGALAVLVWIRPAFTIPFTCYTVAVGGQFRFPFAGESLTQPYLLIRLLILFIAMFLLLVLSRRNNATDFIYCAIAMLAASYFVAGLGKLRLDWLSYGHLYHALPTTYTNGWLAFLDPEALTRLVRAVSALDAPMRVTGFVLECAAVLFFARRSLAVVLVAGWAVFHVGVFLLSGICFWMWTALDVGLIFFLLNRDVRDKFALFTPARGAVAAVLIAGGSWWFDSINLAWYDARASYTYVFEAIDESGDRRRLSPQFFAPYETPFTMGAFSYLVDEPVLPIVWGATFDRQVAEGLLACRSREEVFELERKLGAVRYDRDRLERLEHFLRTFIGNVEARKAKTGWWRALRPPPQLWSLTPTTPFWLDDAPTAKVVIRQLLSDWDGIEYKVIRDQVIHEVTLR